MIHHPFPESAQITDEERCDSMASQAVALIIIGMVLGACMGIAGTLLIMTEVV